MDLRSKIDTLLRQKNRKDARAKKEHEKRTKEAEKKNAQRLSDLKPVTQSRLRNLWDKAQSTSIDTKQAVFVLAAVLISLGGVISGVNLFDFNIQNITLGALFPSLLTIIGILILQRSNLLEGSHSMALFLLLGMNMFFTSFLEVIESLTGSSMAVGISTILYFLVFSTLVIHIAYPETFGSDKLFMIYLIILVLLFSGSIYAYFVDGGFDTQVEQGGARLEARQLDIMESIRQWFGMQRARTNGTLITGETEDTFEFVGLEVTEIISSKDRYAQGDDVVLDVSYQSNVYFPVTLHTSCYIQGQGAGIVDEPSIEITSAETPTLRCTFPNLGRGSYTVYVDGTHNYESTVYIPLKIMDRDFSEALTRRMANSQGFLRDYVGGESQAITSSGPIRIGVATAGQNLQTPLLYSPDASRLTRLRFQFQENQLHGDIYRIERASFDVPEGMQIQNCDFGAVQRSATSLMQERWIFDVDPSSIDIGSFNSFGCDVLIDPSYQNKFIPESTQWSPQSIWFSLEYYNKITETSVVTVQ